MSEQEEIELRATIQAEMKIEIMYTLRAILKEGIDKPSAAINMRNQLFIEAKKYKIPNRALLVEDSKAQWELENYKESEQEEEEKLNF